MGRKNQRGCIDWFVVIMLAAFALILAGVTTLVMWGPAYKCGLRGEEMGLNHRWSFVGGCRFEVGNRYVPIEMIRITDTGEIIITGEVE